MSHNISPLEDQEQTAFVEYLELLGLKFTAVPNSTYTTSWKQKAHNRRVGLRAGFPDLIVLIPPDRAIDGVGRLLPLEMKRVKGGVISDEQRGWIDALNELGTDTVVPIVARGAQEAIDYVNTCLALSHSTSPF